MTVGQLSERTGMSIKMIRKLESRGLIYNAGRTASNYRLFDDTALWCVQVVGNLRGLGLTLDEIEGLAGVLAKGPPEEVAARLDVLLTRAEERIDKRIAELHSVRRRVRSFRNRA